MAYSGGRDSGVLLSIAARVMAPSLLTALHVDHGFRPQAEREAEKHLVTGVCARLGVAIRFWGPPTGGLPQQNWEAWFRRYRYLCFEEYRSSQPGARVFLAHHAQDQAETVLMRLLQGRSWRGLGGIPEVRGAYYRPFLSLEPALLDVAAQELCLPVWTDSTNAASDYLRNDLRNRVFPLLLKRFPRAVTALGEFSERWNRMLPTGLVDSRWSSAENGFQVPLKVWNSWQENEKEAQLLALVQLLQPECRLPGRFLETLVRRPVVRGIVGEGAGFRLSVSKGLLRWHRVAKVPSVQYFKQVVPGMAFAWGPYQVALSEVPSPDSMAAGWFDPQVPVWSASKETAVTVAWSRNHPNRGFGAKVFFLGQQASVFAVVDFEKKQLVWAETSSMNLNARQLFVNLMERSEYERR